MIHMDINEFLDVVYSEYSDVLPKISKEQIKERVLRHYNNKLKYRNKEELSRLKLVQLKELCEINCLKKTGKKSDLIQLLIDYYKH